MSLLPNDLTSQIAWNIGDMYPASVTLPNELGELDASFLLHLLDELEQPAVVGLVACDNISRTSEDVVAVLHATHQFVELLAAVARGYNYRFAPRLAYGVKELVY